MDIPISKLKKSIRLYTQGSDNHIKINNHLKKHGSCNGLEKSLYDVCDTIYKYLSKNTIEEDTIVYRGLDNKDMDKKEFIDSKLGENKKFLSTSLSQSVASNFAGKDCCIFDIKLRKGTNAANVSKLSPLNAHEEEVLVLPGGRLILDDTRNEYSYKDKTVIPLIYDTENSKYLFGKRR